jgi:DNA invertase Pin-like site-specific DNA recombinase
VKELEGKLKYNKIYNPALYCRLSLDDGSVGESGSIQTQKIILEEYAKVHGFKITCGIILGVIVKRRLELQ